MAVTLDGGTGLFDQLGAMAGLVNLINARRGGAASTDYPNRVLNIQTKFVAAANNLQAVLASIHQQLAGCQAGHDALLSMLKASAQELLINSFNNDDPLPALTVLDALYALDKQMRTATTRYVAGNTVSATVTHTGNTGTGATVAAVIDGLGRTLENLIAEDLVVSVSDVSTPAAPSLRVRGEVAASDRLAFAWPDGSGADATYTAIDASDANAALTNGDFEDFTVADTPDGWTIAVGAAGADILSEASTVYAGSKALEILGDGSTLTQIYQSIAANVEARKVYCVNFWCKVSSNPAAGALILDVHDGSNVIADEAGTNQTVTIDLTTLGTTYVAKQFYFRLPEPLPTTIRLRVRVSTAITNTHSLFIDHMALAQLVQPLEPGEGGLYHGHVPFLGFFSGATNWALDDGYGNGVKVWKIASANNAALTGWQRQIDRFFDAADLGFTLPIAGTTVIDPALIA